MQGMPKVNPRGCAVVMVCGTDWAHSPLSEKSMYAAATGCAVLKPEWVWACIAVCPTAQLAMYIQTCR